MMSSEQALSSPSKSPDPHQSLKYNSPVHFGKAYFPVLKDDRKFGDLKTLEKGTVLQLNLKGIPVRSQRPQVYGLQDFPLPAIEPTGKVPN